MQWRHEGLVQLRTGDALTGLISRRSFVFRYLRVEQGSKGIVGISENDPNHPTKIDGVVLVPKRNISFIQAHIHIEVD
jgi:hypothetical protein